MHQPFHETGIVEIATDLTHFDWLRIETRLDNGPIRLTTHGRRPFLNGRHQSLKSGGQPWESMNERHAMWLADLSPEVIRYQVQPHTLHWSIEGRRGRYTPDRADNLVGGAVRIVEVKGRVPDDQLYLDRLKCIRLAYDLIGWSHEVVCQADIEFEPTFSSVKKLIAYRRTIVTARETVCVRRLLQQGPDRVSTVEAELGGGLTGFAKLAALAARRVVAVDLSTPLNNKNLVYLVHPDSR